MDVLKYILIYHTIEEHFMPQISTAKCSCHWTGYFAITQTDGILSLVEYIDSRVFTHSLRQKSQGIKIPVQSKFYFIM